MIDLILTQTLGSKLLWHLVTNYILAKLYVISLLYTLNSIMDYRTEHSTDARISFRRETRSRTTVSSLYYPVWVIMTDSFVLRRAETGYRY
jgi:hypothetical protein